MKLPRFLRRRPRVDAQLELRSRLELYRQLVQANNRILGLMADAEEKLAGEYLFDSAYLAGLEAQLAESARAVVERLAAISGDAYRDLSATVDRILLELRAARDPAGAGASAPLVVPLADLTSDDATVAGGKMARLGEIGGRLQLRVPGGFVISATACRRLLADPALARLFAAVQTDASVAPRLEEAIRSAHIPDEIRRAMSQALARYEREARFAVRSSALAEDGHLSFAGQHRTVLGVRRDDVPSAWLSVVASLFSARAMSYRAQHQVEPPGAEMAVGCLEMIAAEASGVLYTIDPAEATGGALRVTAVRGLGQAVVEGTAPTDVFHVARTPPHPVLARAIADKRGKLVVDAATGTSVVELDADDRRRPAIDDAALAVLAAAALRIERHFARPQDIEWAIEPGGRVIVLQARDLELGPSGQARIDLGAARARHPVLARNAGEIACRGVGAGRVTRVGAEDEAAGFRPGDVLVSSTASPRLSAYLRTASALVTEVGTVTGHLATVARELRVPAIVGAGAAAAALTPGQDVTVDADEHVIYAGTVEELLRYQLLRAPAYQETPEFRVLRRMLRPIAPLNLVDPLAPGFTADGCRTLHDVIRFAHERALAELSRIDGSKLQRRGQPVARLDLEVPIDLLVVDLGGGLEAGARRVIGPAQVASRPLRALIDGLSTPGAWSSNPADMDLEGFMASATRAGPLTLPTASTIAPNVALVASDYVNLNLRLGYHVNVVDSYLGEESGGGYVFFRFVGGVTEIVRRTRRARLLAAILGHHGFRTEQRGQLVVGRLLHVPAAVVEDSLRMIGRLIGFSRQLDILLRDDAIVDRLVQGFLTGRYETHGATTIREVGMEGRIEVLVLDDEPTVCERLKEHLEKKDMTVETFLESKAAIERLGQKRFDVVVTDLKMKGPTGLDVLMAVKERKLATQVIIITGYRTIEAARGAEVIGAFEFLDKPFRLEDLHDLVKKAARKARKGVAVAG